MPFLQMTLSDAIQIIVASIALFTVYLLWKQTRIQNKLANAQLYTYRLDLYRQMEEPTGMEILLERIRLFQDDYFDSEVFEKRYKDKEDSIRKYMYMFDVYEFMVFTYNFGRWDIYPFDISVTTWLDELVERQEFRDVHNFQRKYYPKFGTFVDKVKSEKTKSHRS